jgi:hypothetical protein
MPDWNPTRQLLIKGLSECGKAALNRVTARMKSISTSCCRVGIRLLRLDRFAGFQLKIVNSAQQ